MTRIIKQPLPTIETVKIYDGASGGAYNGKRYLTKSISSEGKEVIYSSLPLNKADDIEPRVKTFGGIIVFPSHPITSTRHRTLRDFLWPRATQVNRVKRGVCTIGNEWTIGHYFRGRFTTENGTLFDNNSLSVEIAEMSLDRLLRISHRLCLSIAPHGILVKHSGGEVYLLKPR